MLESTGDFSAQMNFSGDTLKSAANFRAVFKLIDRTPHFFLTHRAHAPPASGSRSITVSRTRAARSGTRRPCSQSCTARTSRPNRSANFWRLNFMRFRSARMCFADGSSTIRHGRTVSPRTWARTSPKAASTSRPTWVRSRCHWLASFLIVATSCDRALLSAGAKSSRSAFA